MSETFSKYEKARILGARALQISMDAPILKKMSNEELEEINYDPLRIAEKELESGVLPITIKRPMPVKNETDLEKLKIKEDEADREKEEEEKKEEEQIREEGEIMEIIAPEDEEMELSEESESGGGELE